MTSEKQIRANRLNALKSTGPRTPEGKQRSSKNAALPSLLSGTIVLKGESIRRFNEHAAALILQFQPRTPAEVYLVQTMSVARWHLLRIWGIQTAGFELEMARARQHSESSAYTGAVLAAATFRHLSDTSGVLALQHRLEVSYDRQYTRALAMLLKLRETRDPNGPPALDLSDPSLQIVTETWDEEEIVEPDLAPEALPQPLAA